MTATKTKIKYLLAAAKKGESAWFYQSEHAQGFTTDLPNDQKLAQYLESGFANTGKDYSQYLAVLEALGARKGDRVLDFGCSWGYGSWQLNRHGFRVESFEISRPRGTSCK